MKTQTPAQIGVCSWSLQAGGPKDLAEKVSALGLNRVQLGLTPHREDPGAWEGALEIMTAAGIAIVSGMFSTIGEDYTTPDTIRRTGGVVPDQHWEANWALAKAAAATAKSMGLKLVSTHAGFLPHQPTDPSFDKLASRVADLAALFAENGTSLLLETGQESAETLLLFLDEMRKRGARNIAVNFDPANMILYDMGDPIQALRLLAPHVMQVHVKDARRTNVKGQWGDEVVVGTGEVDWREFVQILAAADFQGSYIFEREAGNKRLDDIAQGITTLRTTMERASA